MALYSYDPKSVAVVAVGIPITGWGPNAMVKWELNEDAYTLTVGVGSDAVREKTNNWSARMTITLLQTSEDNAALSAIAQIDRLSPFGDGIGPSGMKDLNGLSIYACEFSWIVKMPTSNWEKKSTVREWVIETDELDFAEGGQLRRF